MNIGILGAARIAPTALINPAKSIPNVTITAIAARNPKRAQEFATKHNIPKVHDNYTDLITDPQLDAVYIPLPNSKHAEWTLAALKANKHVLCEKPLTSNANQAKQITAAAKTRTVMEAFHYRYHPLAQRMKETTTQLGKIKKVETSLCFPLPTLSNIRYSFDLAGGALMDAGCYAVNCLRLLSPTEPKVTTAKALTLKRDNRIDRAMTATFAIGEEATGHIQASLWSSTLLRIRARVTGDRGTMTVTNFVAPHVWSRMTVEVDGRRRRERVTGESTYVHQLRAFAAAVAGEPTNLTPPEDSIATMALIDDIYTAAGLPVRT